MMADFLSILDDISAHVMALCMLSYAHCGDVDNSMVLDKVLYEGDALYQAVIRKLKSDGKLSQHLLSLEEIPDDFEVEIGKFTLDKFHIEIGPLIDTQDIGLPTLHEVLQLAFLSVSSGLLTVGAICSAVFKKKGAYAFFDSHCHGHNGLSATDGASSLITFSSLDDLVRYMYAFYDSMKLDTSMQYDFLPINVKKSQNKQSYKDEMASHMVSYFNDQRLRQANKSQSEVRSISNDLSSIAIEKSKKKLYGLKERNLKIAVSISKYTKENVDKTLLLRPKKVCIRKNQNKLQEKILSLKQNRENQSNLPDKILLLGPKKVCIKNNQSNLPDKILVLGPKKVCIRKNQSNLQEKIQSLKQKKENQIKAICQIKSCFRAKERMYQKETKQSARKDPVFKTKKENQSNLQEKILSLKQKKENQSNLPEKILSLKQKKENQSNLQGNTMF